MLCAPSDRWFPMYLYVSVSRYVSLLPKQRNWWRAILWPDVASQTCIKNVPTFCDIPPKFSHRMLGSPCSRSSSTKSVTLEKLRFFVSSSSSSFEASQVSNSSTFKDARQHLGQNEMISTGGQNELTTESVSRDLKYRSHQTFQYLQQKKTESLICEVEALQCAARRMEALTRKSAQRCALARHHTTWPREKLIWLAN